MYKVRSLVMVRNQLPAQVFNTSTTKVAEEMHNFPIYNFLGILNILYMAHCSQYNFDNNNILMILTSYAGTTRHARREYFVPNYNIFSVLSIFINVTRTKQMINLLLLNNFYIQWYHADEFERKRKRRIIVYGSVTRYGPRTGCKRKESIYHSTICGPLLVIQ